MHKFEILKSSGRKVFDCGKNFEIKYKSGFEFVSKFGSSGSGDGQFTVPTGIAIGGGYIFVGDYSANRIQKFDLSGNFVSKWGSSGSGDGQFNQVEMVRETPDGNYIWVAEGAGFRVQKFDLSGNFVSKISIGTYCICALQYLEKIYISTGPSAVRIYNATTLAYIASFGSYGTGDGQFDQPKGLAATGDYLFVGDFDNANIQKFDLDGNFISKWGSSGSGDGQFANLSGIKIVGNYLYAAERTNHRIQKFDLNGNFITKYGSSGSGDGQFNQCYDVNAINTKLYCCDLANDRIQIIKDWGPPY